MHICTLKIFLQITCSLHEGHVMNSFEMHPDHFWVKKAPLGAGWGCTVQSSKPGGKSFPQGPGDQSLNTQSINSARSSSSAKKTSFFQRMEGATTVDWVLPLCNVILRLIEIGQTGKTYCVQKKGLLIHCSLPTENSPATIQHTSRWEKKKDNNIKKSNKNITTNLKKPRQIQTCLVLCNGPS